MSSSKGNVPVQQGLASRSSGQKRKQSAAASEHATTTGRPTVGHPSSTHEGTPSKRKLDAHTPPQSNSSYVAKRPRKDDTIGDRNGQLKKKKSVTFADAPSKNDTPTSTTSQPAQQKKAKGPSKKQKTPAPTDIKPALEYLRLWKTARSSWKFNKNHQSALIKHVFDAEGIPAADIDAFYDYIKDLKGFIRMRLRETALEVRSKDQSEGGAAFPEGTADLDATQERYETVLAKFLQSQTAGCKRKAFSEDEYLSDSDDGEVIIQRLVKRMRAELVIEELSDGDTEMSTTSSATSRTITSDKRTTASSTADKKVKLNDGTGKRRRKLRINMDDSDSESSSSSSSSSDSDDDESDDDTSDSKSDSESDSGTSSSGSSTSSSGESSDDDDSDGDDKQDNDDSSSSSSSSSDDEADSEDASDDSSDEE